MRPLLRKAHGNTISLCRFREELFSGTLLGHYYYYYYYYCYCYCYCYYYYYFYYFYYYVYYFYNYHYCHYRPGPNMP